MGINPATAAVAVHGARAYTTAGPMAGKSVGNGAWGNTVHQHLACFAAETFSSILDADDYPAANYNLAIVQAAIAQAKPFVGRWAHVYQPSAGQADMSCTICNLPLYIACDHCLDGEAMMSGICPKCGTDHDAWKEGV